MHSYKQKNPNLPKLSKTTPNKNTDDYEDEPLPVDYKNKVKSFASLGNPLNEKNRLISDTSEELKYKNEPNLNDSQNSDYLKNICLLENNNNIYNIKNNIQPPFQNTIDESYSSHNHTNTNMHNNIIPKNKTIVKEDEEDKPKTFSEIPKFSENPSNFNPKINTNPEDFKSLPVEEMKNQNKKKSNTMEYKNYNQENPKNLNKNNNSSTQRVEINRNYNKIRRS